jgi:hypothetical protein
MKKKVFLSFTLILLAVGNLFAQRFVTATTLAYIQLSDQSKVYFFYEPTNSEYYKSAATEISINAQETIKIWIPANRDSMFMCENQNGDRFYSRKIVNLMTQIPEDLTLLLPSYDNEILFFENSEHLAQLYNLTSQYIETISGNDSTELFLNNIEKLFEGNFTSFRSYINNKYSLDSSYTEDQFILMSKENFISDEILNTYFNQYRLIGLGDTVYYYHNREEILSTHKSNELGIQFLKEKARFKDDNVDLDIFNNISAIDLEKYEITYKSKKGKKGHNKGIYYQQNPFGSDTYYQTIAEQIDDVEQCNPYKKGIKLETWYGNVNSASSSNYNYYTDLTTYTTQSDFIVNTVQLVINWGDSSSPQVVNNYTNKFAIYHTYPQGSQTVFNVTIETKLIDFVTGQVISIFDGANYPVSGPIIFHTDVACTTTDKQIYKVKNSSDGNWKMLMSGWISENLFGSHIGGYTRALKKQSNGNWKLEKAKIKVHVEGVFRNDSCIQNEFKSGQKEHDNDKKIEKIKAKLFKRYSQHANGDVKTKHRLIKGGIILEDQIILNPCQ